ncbi:hypothetical protein AB9E06_21565 [Rhizobium leguminosarum]|uniref:hypothetical protein n=1 Tax=Rhizobium leguminosarum TaxID=384 RepID=UPI003F94F729
MDDWSLTWKIVSILLTALFAIVALFAEHRDKTTNKITKWAWISFCGLVVSAVVGGISLVIENEMSKKSAEAQEKYQNDVLLGLQASVRELGRLATPLGKLPPAYVVFDLDCGHKSFKPFCAAVSAAANGLDRNALVKGTADLKQVSDMPVDAPPDNRARQALLKGSSKLWTVWPGQGAVPRFQFMIYGFRSDENLMTFKSGKRAVPDVTLSYETEIQQGGLSGIVDADSGLIRFTLVLGPAVLSYYNGSIYSVKDLVNLRYVIVDQKNDITGFKIIRWNIIGETNDSASLDGANFAGETITTPDGKQTPAVVSKSH